eukprot:c8499_g1_i1.p1 GENE.c8499_g1_i1~~c8499_g1_i1.p1  ORF type:complete len:912 (+),score=251.25 c8499_g1_i1:100-2835(+)
MHTYAMFDSLISSRRFVAANVCRVLAMIDAKYTPKDRGDVLIFLSGTFEISKCQEECQQYAETNSRWIILPLHSQLPVEQQDKVFDIAPDGVRKCILSTNIAETSITIDGIRFVVDTGRQKEMAHSLGGGVETAHQWLVDKWISKASAEQRKGRAGRTGPGTCFRLYKPEHFRSLSDFAVAEIHRCALEGALLTLLSLGHSPLLFHFVDKPCDDRLSMAMQRLRAMGCVDSANTVTRLGSVLSTLPLEPGVGRMVVVGALLCLTEPTLTVAAATSVQTPFAFDSRGSSTGRPASSSEAVLSGRHEGSADTEDAQPTEFDTGANAFRAREGDAHTLLKVFDEWLRVKAEKGRGSASWCKRKEVIEERLYEMAKVRRQLVDMVGDGRLKMLSEDQPDSGSDDDKKQKKHKDPLVDDLDRQKLEEKRRTRRKLRFLQRKHSQQTGKRVLSMHNLEVTDDKDTGDNDDDKSAGMGLDIRHLDFRVMYSLDDLQAGAGGNLGPEEGLLMSFVVACGTYPNIAYGDANNQARNDSEKVFLTSNSQQAFVHPSSVLACVSQFPQDNTWPQVVCFSKLLTTSKSYLVNCTRLHSPLQYLLLLSPNVDVSEDCSVVVVDHWLRFEISAKSHVQELLVAAAQLRAHLGAMLSGQLTRAGFDNCETLGTDTPPPNSNTQPPTQPSTQSSTQPPASSRALPQLFQALRNFKPEGWSVDEFSGKLVDFLRAHVQYNLSPVPKNEILAHYNIIEDSRNAEELADITEKLQSANTPADTLERMERFKKGEKIGDFFVLGCVRNKPDKARLASDCMSIHFTCDTCGQRFIFNRSQILRHREECGNDAHAQTDTDSCATPSKTAKHALESGSLPPEKLPRTSPAVDPSSFRLRGSRVPPAEPEPTDDSQTSSVFPRFVPESRNEPKTS